MGADGKPGGDLYTQRRALWRGAAHAMKGCHEECWEMVASHFERIHVLTAEIITFIHKLHIHVNVSPRLLTVTECLSGGGGVNV